MDQSRFVFEALTRYNFFPNQKSGVGEIPPIFNSRRFTPEVVHQIINDSNSVDGRDGKWFDLVEYASTRYNNVPRMLGIPHPVAYGRLAKSISDNWESIKHICENDSSKVKPDFHADNRLIIMNYEGFREKVIEKCRRSFGKRFLVSADVAGCFNTVYTHAIEWAAIGFEDAKNNLGGNQKGRPEHWAKKLDKLQRRTRRGETQGITIGPASSSVIVELILSEVDKKLQDEFEFARYIDDYICYCSDSAQAELFIQKLAFELKKFKLSLNLSKTKVEALPLAIQTDWTAKLHGALPAREGDEQKYSADVIIHFLEYAISLNNQTPDGSVLKYALRQVVYRLHDDSIDAIADYLVNLSWHYPLLLPFVGIIFDEHEFYYADYQSRLNEIIRENARNGRSDGMCWPLYFIHKYKLELEENTIRKVFESGDCLALCIVMRITGWTEEFRNLIAALSIDDVYAKDRQWVLLYQAYIEGYIDNPYHSEAFRIMHSEGVDFMPRDQTTSRAEGYCTYLEGVRAFGDDEIPIPYQQFLAT